jgi:hypothetical protein
MIWSYKAARLNRLHLHWVWHDRQRFGSDPDQPGYAYGKWLH